MQKVESEEICVFLLKFHAMRGIMVSQVTGKPHKERKQNMKTLETGKTYTTRCYNDHELVEAWTITKKPQRQSLHNLTLAKPKP